MTNTTVTPLIKIGNSRGIRIPKVMIEQLGLEDGVALTIEEGRLVITPAVHPRAGWEEQFKAMHEAGDDQLLDEYVPTQFDLEEWEW